MLAAALSTAADRPESAPAPQADVSLFAEVAQVIDRARMDLISVRRDLHTYPDLSGAESRTASVVATRLRSRGLDVRVGVGGHGVVGVLRGALQGPTIAFRADMDAVSSTARDPVDFPSLVPGVRHICGHDIHTAVALALVDGLSAVRSSLSGSVVFLFQPAEETAQGARAMLDADALPLPRPEAIFAFHTAPLPVGQIGTKGGALLPGRDRVTVSIRATPSRGDLAERVVATFRSLSTIEPGGSSADPFVVTVSAQSQWLAAGSEWRITSDLIVSDPVARDAARARLDVTLSEVRGPDIGVDVEWLRRIPGAVNDRALELSLRPAIEGVVGSTGLLVSSLVSSTFSEDFGWFQEEISGVMYWLGVANAERGWAGVPHSPDYAADEDSIQVGARVMAAILLDQLRARKAW